MCDGFTHCLDQGDEAFNVFLTSLSLNCILEWLIYQLHLLHQDINISLYFCYYYIAMNIYHQYFALKTNKCQVVSDFFLTADDFDTLMDLLAIKYTAQIEGYPS